MQETDFQGQSGKTQNPKNFNDIHDFSEMPKDILISYIV